MSDQNQPIENHGLVRGMGLLQATALNMSNMVGVGVFVTIPLIIAAMGGPQCMLGWVMGAILALCDGLVWSELAAAMPGTGGTYLYLREAFKKTRVGEILPFLFIWQFIFSGPLEIASGYIGFAQYVGYFWHDMGVTGTRLVSVAVGVLVIALLYRGISAVGKLTVVLWVGMLVTLLWVIVSGFLNFNSKLAFDFPPGAFTFSSGFLAGFGSAMLIAMYDLLGYYDICYVGGEVRNPERVIPRSIIYSVIAIASMYLLTTLSIISVIPWREAMHSKFIASEFIEKLYGGKAAALVTALVLWTAFASLFALLLGYSRIPYAAAINGHFFKSFGKLHPTGQIPLRIAAGDGRALHRRQSLVARSSDHGAFDVANSGPVHRPDHRPGFHPPQAHRDPAALQDVALPNSQHHRVPGLDVRLRNFGLDLRRVRPVDDGSRDSGLQTF